MLTRSRIILIAVAALPLYVVYDYVKLQYWRERLEAMCYEDGGHTIYKQVVIPKEEFERFASYHGVFSVPWDRDKDTEGHPYKYSRESERVKSGNPTIGKSTYLTYRVADGEVVGKAVYYSMAAAPLFRYLSAFRYDCVDIPGFYSKSIEEEIFSKGE